MSDYQSPVEWLIQQVEDFNGLLPADIIEKSKQMEQEQNEILYRNAINDMIEAMQSQLLKQSANSVGDIPASTKDC